MSVRRWCVSSLTLVPSKPSLRHQMPRPLTTPGRARSLTCRRHRLRPRSLNDAHQLAVGEAARRRVVGVHLEQRLALDVAQALDVDEARVEEVARRRRDHRQRIAPREFGRRLHRLVVRHEVGHAQARARRSCNGRSGVGKPPSANGASARGNCTQPCSRSASNDTASPNGHARQRLVAVARSRARRSPCAPPVRERSACSACASPSGAIAGSLISTEVWP